MGVLIDTNILLRSVQTHHPHYPLIERAFAVLRAGNETPHVAVQNLVEFWAVATRPTGSANGLGLTIEQTVQAFEVIKSLFTVLPEPPAVFVEWERLVTTYRVSGKNTHDARLVAVMRLHGITRILTFNADDFARYPGIEVINPQKL